MWSFERASGPWPSILLLSAAAHGCVLPPENLEVSAEWIGAAVAAVGDASVNLNLRPVSAVTLRGAARFKPKRLNLNDVANGEGMT